MKYRKLNRVSLALPLCVAVLSLSACGAETGQPNDFSTGESQTLQVSNHGTQAAVPEFDYEDADGMLSASDFRGFLGQEMKDGEVGIDRIAGLLDYYGESYFAYRLKAQSEINDGVLFYDEAYCYTGAYTGTDGGEIRYEVVTLSYAEGFCFLFTDDGGWQLRDVIFCGKLDAVDRAVELVKMPGLSEDFLKITSVVGGGTGIYTCEEMWYHINSNKTVLSYVSEDMDSGDMSGLIYDMTGVYTFTEEDENQVLNLEFSCTYYGAPEEGSDAYPVVLKQTVPVKYLWDDTAKIFILRENPCHWMLLKYSDTFAGQSPHMSAADTLAVFYDLIQEMQSNGSAVQKSWAEDLKRLAAGIY